MRQLISRLVSRSMALTRRIENFQLGPFEVPRIWMGLWQLSSSAWGSASVSQIRQALERHVEHGYTAFGECTVALRTMS